MGFPGGRVEPGDLTPADTAVRELEEELGVAREAVKVHGLLPPQAALDGRPVAAVIATAAINKKDFVPSPDEVDAVFLGSWEHFRRQNDQAFEFNAFGNWRLSHLFTLSDFRVWGLTAKILFDADLR
jgi:8-oxo-dGTP pyrophosphatase MutT (NUDIX family)